MNVKLSDNDHFQFGYTETHQWTVSYGKCSREPKNFHDECLETARTINKNTSEDITVLFSGGVDSEVAVRSFVEAGIKINVAIMRFKDGLNSHDIEYAIETCREFKITPTFYDLDLLGFWKEDYLPYAHLTRCFSPQLITTMWLIDQIPGFIVLGSGECLLEKKHDHWYLLEKERIASWYRFFIKRNRSGCPGFFQYTPEIMLSYLNDPEVVKMVKDSVVDSSTKIKLEMYQQHFPVKTRPKFTGFEKVQHEDHVIRTKLKELYGDSDQIAKTEYHQLIKSLSNR